MKSLNENSSDTCDCQLRLYISQHNAQVDAMIRELDRIVERRDGDRCSPHFTVINVQENPDAAERDLVLATPTLIVESPETSLRLIGDLTTRLNVLREMVQDPLDRCPLRQG